MDNTELTSIVSRSSSDLDLEKRVITYIFGRKVPSLYRLEVRAENGTVTLRGIVGSFYERQLAISCCGRVAGVLNLIDEIDVTPQETHENRK